jgi:hypothetical protein
VQLSTATQGSLFARCDRPSRRRGQETSELASQSSQDHARAGYITRDAPAGCYTAEHLPLQQARCIGVNWVACQTSHSPVISLHFYCSIDSLVRALNQFSEMVAIQAKVFVGQGPLERKKQSSQRLTLGVLTGHPQARYGTHISRPVRNVPCAS